MKPEHVVLGEIPETSILVEVRDTAGPVQCETLRIHANTGDVSPLTNMSPGMYSSNFVLPEDYFPRFALIAAVGTCNGIPIEGHTVVPLYGTGEVEVKAKPYSDVTLRIAEQVFGPKRTNAWGKVRIPIVVPPGHFVGIAGDKTVDLNLPPVNRIVAIADRTVIKAGDEGRTIVWIFAIDPQGTPLIQGEISAVTDKGEVTPPEALLPGVYRSYYTGPTLIGDQQGNITVNINGDPSSKDLVGFTFTPGDPSQIRLVPLFPIYQAGSGTPIKLEVAVIDQYGNPTGDEVMLDSDFGTLAPLSKGEHGVYITEITIPDRFDGRREVTLTAKPKDGKGFEHSDKLPLKAGRPVSVNIKQPNSAVPADGINAVSIPLEVLDAYDNPVSDVELTLETTAGAVPPSIVTEPETYIPYTPPLGKGTGTTRIEASAGDALKGEAAVPLTDKTYFFSLSLRFGFITNFGNMTAPHFSVSLEQNLWFLLRGLHVAIEFGHYYSRAEMTREDLESGFHAFPLDLLIGYRLTPLPKLFFAFGLGIGPHIIYNKIERTDDWKNTEWGAQLGIHAVGTAGWLLGPGKLILRAGYMYANSSNIELLTGHIGGFTLMFGYRLEFL